MMRPPAPGIAARSKTLTALLGVLLMILGALVAVPAQAVPTAEVGVVQAGPAVDGGIVRAADLSQFRPGNIVSDAVFYNAGTMSEAQIQAFLNSKVTACRAGYVCLKDKTDLTRAVGADAMCNAYAGGGVESAARIIFKVAQACGINPQALIVMLQKEQGLVTDTYPYDSQYRIAMGQGCPDTAACDSRYFGFFNQVHGAAWQLKRYANPPGTSNYFTWYAPGKTWNVRYHPNIDCGSSPVYIENKATAALYYYTPYQPNAAALRAGYGTGDGCSSYGNRNFYQYFNDWFGSTQVPDSAHIPIGNLEHIASVPGGFQLRGWAADPDTSNSIELHVYIAGVGRSYVADLDRPDVGAAFPALGSRHGFDLFVPATTDGGTPEVCAYAINVGQGSSHRVLGCHTLVSQSGSPRAQIDQFAFVDGTLRIAGWALDPDVTDSIPVHLYVGGTGYGFAADRDRPDLAAHYPGYGTRHGFAETVPLSPGTHQICLYAINAGIGSNVVLRCTTVMMPGSPDLGRTPIGNLESVTTDAGSAVLTGWALDPDTHGSTKIHVYVRGQGAEYTADATRLDVGAAYPAYGAQHGFSLRVPLPEGRSDVCAYAINTGPGGNTTLGCRSVTVATAPFGNFESLTAAPGSLTATGWAIDPDVAAPIDVHVYVDGVGTSHRAASARPDVGLAFPASGADHGFSITLPAASGDRTVCLYGINTPQGPNTTLGCKTVRVP
ncbi:hypothetical protein ACFVR6_09305 [Microbacterium sp. NPDC058021]|uniref:hypothetical protein n=1 Tax=Microbacterium sp. NPDC058021 TaxID=3346306 RepID=UPI0036DE402C